VTYLKHASACRVLLVEKTDRLYRNFRDAVTLEDLGIEIHFVKEGQILSKDAKSQVKFMHDIRLAVARNYSENLREEVNKGMYEKAEQGTYPARAPFGYINDKATRTIEVHPKNAAIAQHVFEMYASGRYSLQSLAKAIRAETGMYMCKANVHQMLNNVFYIGQFVWRGRTYVASGFSAHHLRTCSSSLLASRTPLGTRPPSGRLVRGTHGNTYQPRRTQSSATSKSAIENPFSRQDTPRAAA
jgi:site-specific DNA recombinase